MSAGLTRRHRDMLDFIRAYTLREGIPPSYVEMAAGVGLRSKSGAFRLVERLEERGYVKRLPDRARTIVLIGEPVPSLPADVELALADACRETGCTRQSFIEAALRDFLDCPPPSAPQRAAESLLRGRA